MTQKEYQAAFRAARQQSAQIIMQVRRELKKVYTEASALVSAEVARVETAGLSDLTSNAWKQINDQLQAAADIISSKVEEVTPLSISKAYKGYLDADTEYIMDAVKQAGNDYITEAGLRNMGVGVDFRLLQAQATRVLQDGYTFSERVWNIFDGDGKPIGVNGDYQYRIKNLILTGQAQGRDNIKIAKDIQVYVSKGKDAVFKPGRYGKLIPGTAQYKARISGTVDWRSLRLVRSEMNMSLQEAGRLEGTLNPAALNLFNWRKQKGNPIDPVNNNNANSGLRCIDLEANGPYKEDEIPLYPHSNCGCSVEPVLMDQKQFVADLKEWTPGSGGYLDDWYFSQYNRLVDII